MKTARLLTLLPALVLFASSVSAFDFEEAPLVQKPFMKLGRGVANLLTCPFELIHETKHQWSEHGHTISGRVSASVTGVIVGSLRTVHRGVAGACDIVTFPVPKYDWVAIDPPLLPELFPLPRYGPTLYDPEYLSELNP